MHRKLIPLPNWKNVWQKWKISLPSFPEYPVLSICDISTAMPMGATVRHPQGTPQLSGRPLAFPGISFTGGFAGTPKILDAYLRWKINDNFNVEGRGKRADKINPLISWTEEQVRDYIREHNVPYNKLHDQGFPSIACQPCTRAMNRGKMYAQDAGGGSLQTIKSADCTGGRNTTIMVLRKQIAQATFAANNKS